MRIATYSDLEARMADFEEELRRDQRQLHFPLTTITNPHQTPSNDN